MFRKQFLISALLGIILSSSSLLNAARVTPEEILNADDNTKITAILPDPKLSTIKDYFPLGKVIISGKAVNTFTDEELSKIRFGNLADAQIVGVAKDFKNHPDLLNHLAKLEAKP
jgi:hypothetical protein